MTIRDLAFALFTPEMATTALYMIVAILFDFMLGVVNAALVTRNLDPKKLADFLDVKGIRLVLGWFFLSEISAMAAIRPDLMSGLAPQIGELTSIVGAGAVGIRLGWDILSKLLVLVGQGDLFQRNPAPADVRPQVLSDHDYPPTP